MTGIQLKKVLMEERIRQSDLIEVLEMTQQSISAMLKRDDIYSGTLEKIAKFAGKDMSIFYHIKHDMVTNNSGYMVNAAAGDMNINSGQMIEILREQLEAKDKQIEGLINALNR